MSESDSDALDEFEELARSNSKLDVELDEDIHTYNDDWSPPEPNF